MLKDDYHEVRLNIISKLNSNTTNAIGIDMLSYHLLPAIVELAEDKQWRVRLAIIEYIPALAVELGSGFFDEKLSNLCLSWLRDEVYAIREAASINLKNIIEAFGAQWSLKNIIPYVLELSKHSNYLFRITAALAISKLALASGPEIIEKNLIPTLSTMASDPVPNVRFNVAKAIKSIIPALDANIVETEIKPILNRFSEDKDLDVKKFGESASLLV